MSEELQRLIGGLIAKVDSLKTRVDRLEGLLIKVSVGAVTLIFVFIAKQAGLL